MKKPRVPAAQYVRMSTDHQRYSIANQSAAIAAFAAAEGYEIVQTYADKGRSGVTLSRRDALKRLLTDVVSGQAKFRAILIYDVSRWGRFQDSDESAHYEWLVRSAGVTIQYCAEQFANDGSATSSIVKNLKRLMAAEYSRELSRKVFAGQSRLAAQGYWVGGSATFGLRRLVVGPDGQAKRLLAPGEWKAVTTDRVILVPGPPEELEVVRRIFRLYIAGASYVEVARTLNLEGKPGPRGSRWTSDMVRRILKSETYCGTALYNRRSCKLSSKTTHNPPELWIRRERAIEPIVESSVFRTAQRVRERRNMLRYSDEDMLDALRRLLTEKGQLTSELIAAAKDVPALSGYAKRFGSITRAYALIGYEQRSKGGHPLIRLPRSLK